MSRYFLTFFYLSYYCDILCFLTQKAEVYYNIFTFVKRVIYNMKINAYAKINLMLDITGRRPDGYHNVDMIMQTVSLCDVITLEKTFYAVELSGTGELSYDKSNLAYKAARLFFDASGMRGGARIHVLKRIPMCAGMAGGSADAAAVMCGLNILYGKPFSKKALAKLGARLGADVPYCIYGGTARATGIGDILNPIPPLPQKRILVVKPPIAVSTPEAYAGLNLDSMEHPDTSAAADAIERGDMSELYRLMGNSFEYSIFKKYPEIADIKNKLCALGADASLMSGSGSAVFGIFEDEVLAQAAYCEFKDKYKDVFLAHTI